MPKAEDRSSTDGLEILSVGSLYDGPWDKKYWSSSRGKDRYPYPIGYCALQTHNGVTYKMEILEGSSGPIFQITSSDGHSGSGQTPDIAWEAFQKKTSRIKLWHTKRFSCKVDGVEFFGFKNTSVQRLLRELLSSLDGASEQTFPSISVGDLSPATEGGIPLADLPKNSDLQSYLTKSRITGRRSKKCKTTNVSSAPRPDEQASSKQVQIYEKVDKQLLASSWREEYVICNGIQDFPSKVNSNCHQDHFTSATELSCKPSSHCEDKCYAAQLERQHLEDGTNLQSTSVKSEGIEQETLNVKCSDKNQIVDPPVASEQKLHISETENDSEVLEDSEITKTSLLYAPDTLDTQREDFLSPTITGTEEACKKKDELVADDAVSFIEPAGESCPEEETCNDSGYSDFDSVGREAVKSMMELLLPQAVPLLTYSRRKKRRKCSPSKEYLSTPRTSNENDKLQPSGEIDGNSVSNFERQEDHVHNRYPGVTVQSETIAVAPDSFEDGRSEAELTNQVNSLADVTASVEANSTKHNLFSNLNSTVKFGVCKRKFCLQKETDTYHTECHNSATSSLEKLPIYQSEADVVNHKQQISLPSHLITDNLAADKFLSGRDVQKSMDNCSNMDCTSEIKSLFNIGETIAATSDAGQIQINALGRVNSRRMSEETYGPRNSNICQSSYVDMSRRKYNGPLSESIICRDVGDGSLVEEEALSFSNENKECNPLVIGCYSHQKRISAVILKIEVDDIYVCTSCGLQEENERDLFLYKLCIKDPSLGQPSFIGYSTIILPILNDVYGREIPVETSALQFTPDARALVMLDSIQVPYCSERRYVCPCSICASVRFEDNAVKIVQLNKGYVSLVVKLKTLYPVITVLVYDPDCLVALDESGTLYLWFMNSTWSASVEDCVIQSYDYVASRVVELKRIPKSSSLLLGHNGCGDFSLWDISRRTFVSRFSAAASSIIGYLPISLFRWEKGHDYGNNDVEKCRDELISAAANTWLTEFNGWEGKDVGVWILACTSNDSYADPGTWRLALLVKNVVVMGNSYPRPTAIAVSDGGHGIIGMDEGTAYMWDLKDGDKVEILHNFQGVGVSHIATVGSTSPYVTAVAGESGQLWIYKHYKYKSV